MHPHPGISINFRIGFVYLIIRQTRPAKSIRSASVEENRDRFLEQIQRLVTALSRRQQGKDGFFTAVQQNNVNSP